MKPLNSSRLESGLVHLILLAFPHQSTCHILPNHILPLHRAVIHALAVHACLLLAISHNMGLPRILWSFFLRNVAFVSVFFSPPTVLHYSLPWIILGPFSLQFSDSVSVQFSFGAWQTISKAMLITICYVAYGYRKRGTSMSTTVPAHISRYDILLA